MFAMMIIIGGRDQVYYIHLFLIFLFSHKSLNYLHGCNSWISLWRSHEKPWILCVAFMFCQTKITKNITTHFWLCVIYRFVRFVLLTYVLVIELTPRIHLGYLVHIFILYLFYTFILFYAYCRCYYLSPNFFFISWQILVLWLFT